MMAIKKSSVVDDQGVALSTPFPMPLPRPEEVGTYECCLQSCEIGDCPCGGAYPCVERRGHGNRVDVQ